ncbi:DUF72 domain-containing protein [candidate division KSB1 bacterium]|nr:DUF72 domain-containing protein [candidate division KSB1 bacterium]
MRRQDISVGTSGWKFDDWAGTFYPLRVPRSKWLEFYAARFPVGEINSTYYRIAGRATYAGIAGKTPAGFRLFAKVHGDVTHSRSEPAESMRALLGGLAPLTERGKLLGLLAQFPAAFQRSDSNIDYLLRVRDLCASRSLYVEFRHRSWDCDGVRATLRDEGVSWVSPDEPQLESLMPPALHVTGDYAYVRLHGRNARAWNDRTAGDRYDYNYSVDELVSVGQKLLGLPDSVKRAFVLFNNCYHGQAATNAIWLQRWLGDTNHEDDSASENGLHLFTDS